MKISKIMKKLNSGASLMRDHGYNLKKYQVAGVKWMIEREIKMRTRGGILADDPGLGKTIQTLALLVANKKKRTLIIVPTAVIGQWRDILYKIIGRVDVYIHYGYGRTKSSLSIMKKNFSVCLTSHGSIYSHDRKNKNKIITELHIDQFWDRIVIDEGHVIRNHKTKMFKACMLFTDKNISKWILSGTPIQNTQRDIKNLLTFVGLPISSLANSERLERAIGVHLLRRRKEVLGNTLLRPYIPKIHSVLFEDEIEQKEYIRIKRLVGDGLMNSLEELLRLRQCLSHPYIALKDASEFCPTRVSSKIKQMTKDIKKANGLSLVFCHFRGEMTMLSEHLYEKGILSKFYDGTMNIKQRAITVRSFNPTKTIKKIRVCSNTGKWSIKEKYPRVLIIQIQAGSVGLNLQKFNNVFIMTPDWNPCNEIQAISRAHRMGQKKQVLVHKYVMKYNLDFDNVPAEVAVDQDILTTQISKREIMATLLSDDSLYFNEKCDDPDVNSLLLPREDALNIDC